MKWRVDVQSVIAIYHNKLSVHFILLQTHSWCSMLSVVGVDKGPVHRKIPNVLLLSACRIRTTRATEIFPQVLSTRTMARIPRAKKVTIQWDLRPARVSCRLLLGLGVCGTRVEGFCSVQNDGGRVVRGGYSVRTLQPSCRSPARMVPNQRIEAKEEE